MNANTNTFDPRDEQKFKSDSRQAVRHDIYKNGHNKVGRGGFHSSSCDPLQQPYTNPGQYDPINVQNLTHQMYHSHPVIPSFSSFHNAHYSSMNYCMSQQFACPTQHSINAIITPAYKVIDDVADRNVSAQKKAETAAKLKTWRRKKRLEKDENFLAHMQKQGENKKMKRRVTALMKKFVSPDRLAEERRQLSYYGIVIQKQVCNESIYGVGRDTYFEMIRSLEQCTIEDQSGEFGKDQKVKNDIALIEISEEEESPVWHSYSSGMDSFQQNLEEALFSLSSCPCKVVEEYKEGEPDDIVAKTAFSVINRKSMLSLLNGKWLDDGPINYFLGSCLRMRDEDICNADPTRKRSHFLSTHFMSKLVYRRKFDYEKVKKWGKKCPGGDIFNLKYLVIPINESNLHWCCAVVSMEGKKIQLFDSCGSQSMKWLKYIKEYLSQEWSHMYKSEFDTSSWELMKCDPRVPKQKNGEKAILFYFQPLFFVLLRNSNYYQHDTQVMIVVCLCACLQISSRGSCLYNSHKNTFTPAETELLCQLNVAARE